MARRGATVALPVRAVGRETAAVAVAIASAPTVPPLHVAAIRSASRMSTATAMPARPISASPERQSVRATSSRRAMRWATVDSKNLATESAPASRTLAGLPASRGLAGLGLPIAKGKRASSVPLTVFQSCLRTTARRMTCSATGASATRRNLRTRVRPLSRPPIHRAWGAVSAARATTAPSRAPAGLSGPAGRDARRRRLSGSVSVVLRRDPLDPREPIPLSRGRRVAVEREVEPLRSQLDVFAEDLHETSKAPTDRKLPDLPGG